MERISSKKLAPPAGSYSQAVKSGNLIFISGQIAYDINKNRLLNSEIDEQTRCIMDNIKGFLEERGLDTGSIVKVTVYLDDIGDFNDFDRVYREYFDSSYPTRVVAGDISLPKGMLVEVEAIVEEY